MTRDETQACPYLMAHLPAPMPGEFYEHKRDEVGRCGHCCDTRRELASTAQDARDAHRIYSRLQTARGERIA